MVNTNNDGSPATTQPRSSTQTGNDNEEGQIKARESEGTSGRERNENLENTRRTLQQGTELGETNEDEIRKENANQHQRSSRPSEFDVANTNSGRSHEPNNEIQTGRNIPISRSEDVANAERQGLEGLNKQSTSISGKDPGTHIRNESSGRTTEDVANAESSLGNDIQAVAGTSGSDNTRSIWKRK